jgi:ABC-2 type transport system permease protein
MHPILTLLKPRVLSFRNSGQSQTRRGTTLRTTGLAAVGLIFWGGLLALSLRVLLYFRGVEEIGDILNHKLLSMMLITALALLIFSSILTSLSKLYLSRDLFLVHSMPVPCSHLFMARWIDSTVDSSWMVLIYTLPVFLAFGIVYHTGLFFYASCLLTMFSLALAASGIATALVILAVMMVPASRMKSIFIFLGILFFVMLYLAIRLLKPETLVDPEVFDTVMIYITALKTPSSPFLPSTWALDSISAALAGDTSESLFQIGLLSSFSGSVLFLNVILADLLYGRGFSKTQTAQSRLIRAGTFMQRFTGFLPGPIKAHTEKELKSFFRDQSQWSQLFLIGALVVIYVYNFKVLPLDKSPIQTAYLQNLLSFLNMGLALFVLTAVAGRFAYPAVSGEKNAFWLVKSSPGSIRGFLWTKFFIYYIPLLILTELLILITNVLLQVTPFMMVLSTATVFLLVPGIVAMGIGFGAAYPDFSAENPAQTVTSFGGLVFMILCAGLIGAVIIVEAGPVYHLFMADLRGRSLTIFHYGWAFGSFLAVFAMGVAAIVLPMRFGEKRLEAYPI